MRSLAKAHANRILEGLEIFFFLKLFTSYFSVCNSDDILSINTIIPCTTLILLAEMYPINYDFTIAELSIFVFCFSSQGLGRISQSDRFLSAVQNCYESSKLSKAA